MRSIYRRALFVLAIAALPGIAAAEDAFTMHPTDIYAGPDSEYPVIAQLPPNTEVGVAGCLSDWSWCDVRFANDRGWVYAGDLGYPYKGRRVAIVEFGPRLHIPAVTFSLNTYWSAHYRSRPFFRERQQWAGRVHVEANRGGRPPHGASVAEHRGEPAQAPTAQGPQASRERQQAQGTQQRQREATAQRRENEQHAQNEQRAQGMQQAPREQAAQQGEQRRQAQEGSRMSNGQAQSAARSREEQHARQQDRMAQAPEREARANANANTPRGEAERGTAKAQQREQPKEERKEGSQQ